MIKDGCTKHFTKNDRLPNNVQLQIIKQKFFNQFYLLSGLQKLKTMEDGQVNKEVEVQDIDADSSDMLSSYSDVYVDPESQKQVDSLAVQNYECDKSWPICIYDFTFRLIYPDFFCFKEAEPPTLIHNYFDRFATKAPGSENKYLNRTYNTTHKHTTEDTSSKQFEIIHDD